MDKLKNLARGQKQHVNMKILPPVCAAWGVVGISVFHDHAVWKDPYGGR